MCHRIRIGSFVRPASRVCNRCFVPPPPRTLPHSYVMREGGEAIVTNGIVNA